MITPEGSTQRGSLPRVAEALTGLAVSVAAAGVETIGLASENGSLVARVVEAAQDYPVSTIAGAAGAVAGFGLTLHAIIRR